MTVKMKVMAEASDGKVFEGTDTEQVKAQVERYEAGLKEAPVAQVNRAVKAYMAAEGLTGDKTAKRLAHFVRYWMAEGRYVEAASKGGKKGDDDKG